MGIINLFKKKNSSDINVSFSTNVNNNSNNVNSVDSKIQQDYQKAIFLYAESNLSKVKNRKDYVRYLNYECGITNPDIYHKQLIESGYFEKATIEEALASLKITELKNILQKNDLIVKGKKEDLIKKIINEISIDALTTDIGDYYVLSKKGKQFLEQNENLVNLHKFKDYQISLFDYCEATKNDNYKRSFNDIAWQIFNERTIIYQKKEEYGNLRFNYFHMAKLLMKENKPEDALKLFIYCLIIDLSGVESLDMIRSYKAGWCNKKDFLERLDYNCLTPSLIEQIIELKEYYSKSVLEKAYEVVYLPLNVSTIEYIDSLLNEAFTAAIFNYDKYKQTLISNKKSIYLKIIS